METVIQFTPGQVVAFAAAMITISSAIAIIINLISKLKEPDKLRDEKIKMLENRIDTLEKADRDNNDKFEGIEEGNKIIQTALLALLKHSLNGNDTDALKKAEAALESYLINK